MYGRRLPFSEIVAGIQSSLITSAQRSLVSVFGRTLLHTAPARDSLDWIGPKEDQQLARLVEVVLYVVLVGLTDAIVKALPQLFAVGSHLYLDGSNLP